MQLGDSFKEVKTIDGIEVVQDAPEIDPRHRQSPASYSQVANSVTGTRAVNYPVESSRNTICGLRRVTFWLTTGIATLTIVVVAVAIGLAVGLTQQHSTNI